MSDNIVFVKNSPILSHVRLGKFIERFKANGVTVDLWCWRREKIESYSQKTERYLLTGGGYSSKKLFVYYPIWIILAFLKTLGSRKKFFFVVDMDAALPIFLASFFKTDIHYFYDIHDDFSLRYNFPRKIKKLLETIDYKIKNRALKVIHVDPSRVRKSDKNFLIVYNSPEDFYGKWGRKKNLIDKNNQGLTFALAGLLSVGRGVKSVEKYVQNHPFINVIVAGKPIDSAAILLCGNKQVKYVGELKQKTLFKWLANVDCLFALYDPKLEINRLAASNKLYDALMLGKPIVVSDHSILANFVRKHEIGVVVNFDFDESWSKISILEDPILRKKMGRKARKLYSSFYSPEKNLFPAIDSLSEILKNSSRNRD